MPHSCSGIRRLSSLIPRRLHNGYRMDEATCIDPRTLYDPRTFPFLEDCLAPLYVLLAYIVSTIAFKGGTFQSYLRRLQRPWQIS